MVPTDSPFPTVFGSSGLLDERPNNVVVAPKPEPRRTIGMLPTKPDLGAEADIVSTANEPHPPALDKKWTYVMSGFLRAPMRVGLGPRNDRTPGEQLHAPPRIIGLNTYEWTNAGLAPGPEANLYITVENMRAAGTIIIQANTFWDVGFKNVESLGGISQAYVTLKFPGALGDAGGLVWTIGGFSNRYGNAGPRQQSSGYYQTQLFGRTHVLGEALTADLVLGDGLSLMLEHGVGAKTEVIPYVAPERTPPPPRAPWLPEQGPVPQGSNFVHHGHAALGIRDFVTVGVHYLSSWSPNDYWIEMGRAETSSMNVFGAEVHVDDDTTGHGYIGYSHVSADNLLPLADGVEVLHSRNGAQFTDNYFQPIPDSAYAASPPAIPPIVDSGSVDSILFQYLFRLAPVLDWPETGPDLRLAVFGMFNHVSTDVLSQNRLKFGAEASIRAFKHLSGGLRFDNVAPDGDNAEAGYSAITPRLILHSNWINREYIMLSYTRYFLGDLARPSRPYNDLLEADPNMFILSAAVSF